MTTLNPRVYEEWVDRYRTNGYVPSPAQTQTDAVAMLAVVDELSDELSRTRYQLTSANGKVTRHEATLGGILVALSEGGLIK